MKRIILFAFIPFIIFSCNFFDDQSDHDHCTDAHFLDELTYVVLSETNDEYSIEVFSNDDSYVADNGSLFDFIKDQYDNGFFKIDNEIYINDALEDHMVDHNSKDCIDLGDGPGHRMELVDSSLIYSHQHYSIVEGIGYYLPCDVFETHWLCNICYTYGLSTYEHQTRLD